MPMLPNAAPLAGLALRCQPDSRLVALSRDGQEPAFEEIVRRYRRALVRFAGAIVPSHRAEDVVQEALAKAHAALAAGDAGIQLKPWLYAIVRNQALNDLRDEPTHDHLDESFDGVPQPPELAARREELAALLAQVKDLPPAQREALVKRELEGRSHEEIAAALGATPGAARALIFRARTALRDAAGMLVPMPALRALLEAGPLRAEATGAGVGGTAMGLTAGGGGGMVLKGGAALALAVLALGSGVIVHGGGDSRGPARAGMGGGAPGTDGPTAIADAGAQPGSQQDSARPRGEGGGSAGGGESDEGSERSGPSGDDADDDGPDGGATQPAEGERSGGGGDSDDGSGGGEQQGDGSFDGDEAGAIEPTDGETESGEGSGGSSLDGGSETISSDGGDDIRPSADALPDQ